MTTGGIGLNIYCICATGYVLHSFCTDFFNADLPDVIGHISNGIVPMLRAYDATARYVNQGGNKRPGAFAIYIEPWYDIFDFIDLRKNHSKEEARARDLFYALWILDLL